MRVTDAPYGWEQVIKNLDISESEHAGEAELLAGLRSLRERIARLLGLL